MACIGLCSFVRYRKVCRFEKGAFYRRGFGRAARRNVLEITLVRLKVPERGGRNDFYIPLRLLILRTHVLHLQ